MRWISILVFIFIIMPKGKCQETELPFAEIGSYPDEYTANSVMVRMVEGLGFRFYWASEGLRPEDLEYKPSEDARTSFQTIEHIYRLVSILHDAVMGKKTTSDSNNPNLSFPELRASILLKLKESRDVLSGSANNLGELNMVFSNPQGDVRFPFWNLINGPVEDAVWHCGQLVSFRRASGNPFNSKASVLQGKLRE